MPKILQKKKPTKVKKAPLATQLYVHESIFVDLGMQVVPSQESLDLKLKECESFSHGALSYSLLVSKSTIVGQREPLRPLGIGTSGAIRKYLSIR